MGALFLFFILCGPEPGAFFWFIIERLKIWDDMPLWFLDNGVSCLIIILVIWSWLSTRTIFKEPAHLRNKSSHHKTPLPEKSFKIFCQNLIFFAASSIESIWGNLKAKTTSYFRKDFVQQRDPIDSSSIFRLYPALYPMQVFLRSFGYNWRHS